MRQWIIETTIGAYTFLLPAAWIVFAVVLFVVLPMLLWRRTRGVASLALVVASFIFGVTTWCLGAAVTFISFSWLGLMLGLVIFGLGVVPLGIIGAFFSLGMNDLGVSLLVMAAISVGTRFLGLYIRERWEGGLSAERRGGVEGH